LVVALAVSGVGHLLSVGASGVAEGNDTRGALDVRRADKRFVRRPLWRVVTWSRWGTRALRDRGYVLVHLDTFSTPRFDHFILVRSTGARMRAGLFADRVPPRNDRRLGAVPVWRPNRRSLSVRVPLRRLRVGSQRESYRWYVKTIFTSRRCRRTCLDRVPDKGAVEESLEAPQPSPSPTDDD
jgi:hypothetical protein